MAAWGLSSGHGWGCFGEWMCVLLNSHLSFALSPGHFIRGPFGQWQEWLRQKETCSPWNRSDNSFIHTNFFAEVTLWWTFIWNTNLFKFCPFREVYLVPENSLVINFSAMFLPSIWPSSQTIGWGPWGIIAYLWTCLLLSPLNIPVYYSKFCPLGTFSFIMPLHDCSKEGMWYFSHLLLGDAYVLCKTTCKSCPSLFLLGQLRDIPLPKPHRVKLKVKSVREKAGSEAEPLDHLCR